MLSSKLVTMRKPGILLPRGADEVMAESFGVRQHLCRYGRSYGIGNCPTLGAFYLAVEISSVCYGDANALRLQVHGEVTEVGARGQDA